MKKYYNKYQPQDSTFVARDNTTLKRDINIIRIFFVTTLFLTSTAPLSLSCAGTRMGEEHNTEINSRPPFKGNPIKRFCTNERGMNGKIYYVVKNLISIVHLKNFLVIKDYVLLYKIGKLMYVCMIWDKEYSLKIAHNKMHIIQTLNIFVFKKNI